jgi:enoyl-CoA hydratase
MDADSVQVLKEGPVGLVIINRPQVLNALNAELMAHLVTALQTLDQDESIRCLILTGNEKAFAAGADIGEMASASSLEMLQSNFLSCWDQVASVSKPLIAAVSGYALGGGCELALACDLIVASESARFGQPEINLGVMPGAGGTQRLARVLGKCRTLELILTGRTISAQDAERWGLVNRVVPVGTYLDEAKKLALEICQRPPQAVKMAKAAVLRAFETSLQDGLNFERLGFCLLFGSEDQKEGMKAFMEKRRPDFIGK